MANEVRVGLNVTGEQQAKAKLKAVGDQAEKTGDQLEEMGDQALDAGKASDKAGDGFKKAGDDADFLNKRLIETQEHLRELAREFSRTGDTSLLKDIGKEQREFNRFNRVAKLLLPDADVAKAGVAAGSGLAQSLAEGFRTASGAAKGALVPAMVGVAALAAPGIANVVAAAVVGGVGAGGIIGGVALAAMDPRVQAVGTALGEQLTSEFRDAAGGFIEPVMRSLDKVAAAGFADKLAPSFDKLAGHVEPLADGLLGLVDNALPGFQSAIDAAGPVLDVLADALPQIGAALGDFFASISDDPETLANGLELFINAVSDAIRFSGDLIETFIGIYGAAYNVAEALGLVTEKEVTLHRINRDTTGSVKVLAKQTEEAKEAMEDFDKSIRAVFNRTLGVKEATLGYEQAIDDLVGELTDGKRTLDENTQAGRDNWAAINDTARAIEDLRQANVDNGMSMEDAGKQYDAQLEDLRKTLLGLGYNKKAVNDYIDSLKGVPKQALTEIHLKGIAQALRDIKELAGAIGAVTGYAILSVASNLGRRASGGPVMPGSSYIVGENGPELLTMGSSGGYVHNASQTASMMAGSSGGSGTFAAYLQPAPGMPADMTALVRLLIPWFQVVIAGEGGIAQDVLGTPQR